jgi:hypothetical protein
MFILDTEEQKIRQRIAFLKGWKYSIVSNVPFQMYPSNGNCTKVEMCPNWTKNIQDTKTLLDEIKQEFTVEISIDKNLTVIELWSDKKMSSYYDKMFEVEANTLEMAICLAYIAWKTI